MTSAEMIGTYENILAVTAQMLDAARAADWDLLVRREQECRQLVENLMNARSGNEVVLEPQVRRRKVEIIRKVLADDAQIHALWALGVIESGTGARRPVAHAAPA